MRKRSRYEVTSIPTIYEEEAVKLRTPEWNDETRQTVEQLPTYYSCNTSQQRSLSRPAFPKATTDIDLQGKWCPTTAEDHFYFLSTTSTHAC